MEETPLKVNLRSAVRQVKVEGQKVKLRMGDGSQVVAEEVVVAVPASVIVTEGIMFDPPLPKHYIQALSHMG